MQASNDSIWRQDHFEVGDKVEGVGGVDHDVGDVVDDVEDVADVDEDFHLDKTAAQAGQKASSPKAIIW